MTADLTPAVADPQCYRDMPLDELREELTILVCKSKSRANSLDDRARYRGMYHQAKLQYDARLALEPKCVCGCEGRGVHYEVEEIR